MEHPTLTADEKRIVNENVGRLGAQLLVESVPEERWAPVVLAVLMELAGQVLRLQGTPDELDDERTEPQARLPSEAPATLAVTLCGQEGGIAWRGSNVTGVCAHEFGHHGPHSWESPT